MTEFRVLGPLEVVEDGAPVSLPGTKARAVLAVLLLDANRVVSVDRLVDGLWGDDPPDTAAKTVQVYVSQLRKALGAERIRTHANGYSLTVGEDEYDALRFERLAARGRAELGDGDAREAAATFRAALGLWRGRALGDFRAERALVDAGARLDEQRVGVEEDRIDAELALGRHAAVLPEIERLVAEEPLRERPRRQLMLALYRSGRQADALEAFRAARATLVDELGVEPGPDLQELHRAILAQDPELAGPAAAGAPRLRADPLVRIVRGDPVLAGLIALVAAAAVAAGILTLAHRHENADVRELGIFVIKLDNLLRQSGNGRTAVVTAIDGALKCRTTPKAAARQITAAERNRQSVLQQIAALRVPDVEDAVRLSDLLQRALGESIAADWRYRDWLATQRSCPMSIPPAIAAADARTSAIKVEFVQLYNPLAVKYGRPVTSPLAI